MISLYVEGDSLLHRCPAGLKLASFALVALAVFFLPASGWSIVVLLALPLAGFAVARIPLRILFHDARRVMFLLIFLGLTQLIFLPPMTAATNTIRVLSVVLLAQVLTRTTRVESLVDTTQRMFSPFQRWGVNPQKIGLAVALVLTSVGHLSHVITQVRDAQRSRGVRLAPWSWMVPVLVLALKHSDDVGDALTARGLG